VEDLVGGDEGEDGGETGVEKTVVQVGEGRQTGERGWGVGEGRGGRENEGSEGGEIGELRVVGVRGGGIYVAFG